jgi:hypothetical protein
MAGKVLLCDCYQGPVETDVGIMPQKQRERERKQERDRKKAREGG